MKTKEELEKLQAGDLYLTETVSRLMSEISDVECKRCEGTGVKNFESADNATAFKEDRISIVNPLPFILGDINQHMDRVLRDKGITMTKEMSAALMSFNNCPILNKFLEVRKLKAVDEPTEGKRLESRSKVLVGDFNYHTIKEAEEIHFKQIEWNGDTGVQFLNTVFGFRYYVYSNYWTVSTRPGKHNSCANFDDGKIQVEEDFKSKIKLCLMLPDTSNMLRELTMRCQLAFPQNEQDEKWFEEGTNVMKSDFLERLYPAIGLGDIGKLNND